MFTSKSNTLAVDWQGKSESNFGLTVQDLKRLAKKRFTAKQFALMLNLTPWGIYKILSGENRLLAEHVVKIVRESKDTEIINLFLRGTDHVAIPTKFKLNGKWEDEWMKIIQLLGDLSRALQKNDKGAVTSLTNKLIQLLAHLNEEVQQQKESEENDR